MNYVRGRSVMDGASGRTEGDLAMSGQSISCQTPTEEEQSHITSTTSITSDSESTVDSKHLSGTGCRRDEGTILTSTRSTNVSVQTSVQEHKPIASHDRNLVNIPGELTTPPLTPPRDQVSSEPMNGNRNNVSDSAHPIRYESDVAGRNQKSAPEDCRHRNGNSSLYSMHTANKMDIKPPALVVLGNSEGKGHQDIPSRLNKEANNETTATGSDSQHQSMYMRLYSAIQEDEEEGGAVQSLKVTSAGRSGKAVVTTGTAAREEEEEEEDMLSSADEDGEELQLVLVEEEEEEENTREDNRTSQQQQQQHHHTHPHPSSHRQHRPTGHSRATMTSPPPLPPKKKSSSSNNIHSSRLGSPHRTKERTISREQFSKSNNTISTPNGTREKQQPQQHQEKTRPAHLSMVTHSREQENGEPPLRQESSLERTAAVVVNVKQASRVKQFFTTIQQHANKLGSEVAEQVQELIHAVMNETATVEEFHQEIQTVMNYPLKDFIIPFLRNNLCHLRAELKNSSQVLSDILGDVPTSSAVTLTPQLVDDELPVVPPSSKATPIPPMRAITNSHSSSSSSSTSSKSSAAAAGTRSSSVAVSTGSINSLSNHRNMHEPSGTGVSHSHAGGGGGLDDSRPRQIRCIGRKRARTASTGDPPSSGMPTAERERHLDNRDGNRERERERERERFPDKDRLGAERAGEKSWTAKKMRTTDDSSTVITSTLRQPPTYSPHHHTSQPHPSLPPPLPPPPPPAPVAPHLVTLPVSSRGDSRLIFGPSTEHGMQQRRPLAEDWGHVEMMLSSIHGMVERARQSVAVLKERVNTTHMEMERREVERDSIIQQRIKESVESIKHQANEEKQRLLIEASKQLREAVASVKLEVEGKMQQTQNLAVQEALKEANMQSSSKESCWNCGRRATETCSGCNKARYCGTFCQHKDWASHMHHCASGLQGSQATLVDEATHDKRLHRPLSGSGESTLTPTTARGLPIVTQPTHHRTVAIPVNLLGGSQEVNLRLAPSKHASQGLHHTDILVKAEKN